MRKNVTMFEIAGIIEAVDIGCYRGIENSVTSIVGDTMGCYSMTEIKDLEDRRNGKK